MFEGFPYTNFHELNLDWIIKIAKDFLDQYTHIQEVISSGEESLDEKTTDGLAELDEKSEDIQTLLNDWYTTHSSDIADQLADALNDLNSWYTQHMNFLDSYVTSEINQFKSDADAYAATVIASIPEDYTQLTSDVEANEKYQATGKYINEYSITGGTSNYVLSRSVTFAKNHAYKMSFSPDSLFSGSAVQLIINGSPQSTFNPINGTIINATTDITSMGIYIPMNAITGSGTVTMTIEDTTFIPDSQAFQIIGNQGNKITTAFEEGYSSSTNNTYTDNHVNKTHNLEVTIDTNAIYCLCIPTAFLPTNKTLRLAVDVDTSTNCLLYVILTSQKTSWSGGEFLYGDTKKGMLFFEITPEQFTNKSFIMFRMQNGTTAKIRTYLSDPAEISIIDNSITEHTAYHAYKADNANRAVYSGKEYDVDMIGWGDSIMEGTGASDTSYGFFNVLAGLLNVQSIINAACGGETIWTIAARQGATNVKAPAGNPSSNTFALVDELGNPVRPLVGGYLVGNGTPYTRAVKLNEYTGNLGRVAADQYNIDINQSFDAATPIHFPGADYRGEITLIFGGTNNFNPADPEADVPYIQAMIRHTDAKKYVVMGQYQYNNAAYDAAMSKAFGANYFNTRDMLSKYGLSIESITPTAEDTQAMNAGLVPPSLLADATHPNNAGHHAIATLVYQHMLYLGYVK